MINKVMALLNPIFESPIFCIIQNGFNKTGLKWRDVSHNRSLFSAVTFLLHSVNLNDQKTVGNFHLKGPK